MAAIRTPSRIPIFETSNHLYFFKVLDRSMNPIGPTGPDAKYSIDFGFANSETNYQSLKDALNSLPLSREASSCPVLISFSISAGNVVRIVYTCSRYSQAKSKSLAG